MARDTWVRSRAGRVCVCGPARSRAKFLGELYWFWCIFDLFFGFLAPGARLPNNPLFATSSHFAQQQERCVSSKVALLLVSLFSATPLLIGFFSSSSWRIVVCLINIRVASRSRLRLSPSSFSCTFPCSIHQEAEFSAPRNQPARCYLRWFAVSGPERPMNE